VSSASPSPGPGCERIPLFSITRRGLCAAAAALLGALALALPAAAPAASSPHVGRGDSLASHLLLIHGGSFLFEDPLFEPLTRARAVRAGFVPHYLSYPLNDLSGAVLAARAEARRLGSRYRGRLYAYGTSAGGTLAALLAGDGLVSAAAAKAPISDLVGWQWPLGAYGPDYFDSIGASTADLYRLSPLRRPALRPLLIVHGRGDGVVPPSMSRAYAVKFRHVHLWVVEGGHHTERTRPELLSRAFDWLARIAR
jgi:pimeloyl-ACP methyl ester carboxylesterase